MKHDLIHVFLQQLVAQSKPLPPAVLKQANNNEKPREILDPIQILIQQAQWNSNAAASQGGNLDRTANHVKIQPYLNFSHKLSPLN